MVDIFRSGIVAPLNHIKTFDISQIEQAMMHFARGTHIGKVVVTFKDPKSLLPVSSDEFIYLPCQDSINSCCMLYRSDQQYVEYHSTLRQTTF